MNRRSAIRKLSLSLALLSCTGAQATTIITGFPYTLTNGTVADAGQVMANFSQILNQVNNGAAGQGVNADITGLTALSPGSSTAPSVYFSSSSTHGLFYDATNGHMGSALDFEIRSDAAAPTLYFTSTTNIASLAMSTAGALTITNGGTSQALNIQSTGGIQLAPANNITQIVNTGSGNSAALYLKQGAFGAGSLYQDSTGVLNLFNANSGSNIVLGTTSTGSIVLATNGAGRFTVDGNGHITTGGPAPSLAGTCGTGAILLTGSNDIAGTVQMGSSGLGTTCGITFGTSYSANPSCTISSSSAGANLGFVFATYSTTGFTLQRMDGGTIVANAFFNYHCNAYNGT